MKTRSAFNVRKILFAILWGVGSLLALTTPAAADGPYIGLGVMQNQSSFQLQNTLLTNYVASDTSNTTNANLFAGYQKDLSKQFWLAGEIRWVNGYGSPEDTSYTAGGSRYTVSGKTKEALEFSLLPGFRASDSVDLFARIGITQVKSDNEDSSRGGLRETTTTDATVWGLGAKFALTKNFSLRAEYQSLNIKDSNFTISGATTSNNVKTKSSGFGIAAILDF